MYTSRNSSSMFCVNACGQFGEEGTSRHCNHVRMKERYPDPTPRMQKTEHEMHTSERTTYLEQNWQVASICKTQNFTEPPVTFGWNGAATSSPLRRGACIQPQGLYYCMPLKTWRTPSTHCWPTRKAHTGPKTRRTLSTLCWPTALNDDTGAWTPNSLKSKQKQAQTNKSKQATASKQASKSKQKQAKASKQKQASKSNQSKASK